MINHEMIRNMQLALIRISVPVYLGGMARGLLGAKSVLQIRHARSDALKKADLVILAGSVCDFRLSYGRLLPKKGKIITVNRHYDQATMNAGTFWNPDLIVLSDVAAFLISLSTYIYGYNCDPKWFAKLRERDCAKENKIMQMAKVDMGEKINPLYLLQVLDLVLPDNAILIADGGDFVGCAASILKPRAPLSWLDPGAFGTLGVGGGFAIGAKITCPDSQVWILYGDGSCGYSIAEFNTFARHNLPVIALVGNDGGWTQIEREQKPMFGTSVACQLDHAAYHIVARGYGGQGLLSGGDGLRPVDALHTTLVFHSYGQSVLINAIIGKTPFRDGSISV